MSTLYRRLHGIFTTPSTRTSLPPPRTPVTSSPKPEAKPTQLTRRSSVSAMFDESDLKTLARKFKESSSTPWFRSRHSVYSDTVRRLAAANQFPLIEDILEEQKKYMESMSDEGFAVRIIGLYGRAGMFDHALKVFDDMPELNCARTVKSFNAVLAAALRSKKFDRIPEILRDVPQKLGINPDRISYNTVIKAFCEMGSLDSAISVVDEMERNGINPDSITLNMILDGLYQNGRFSDGEHVWASMEKKGIVPCIRSYNAKLRGLVYEKRLSEAVELFKELGTKGGLKPNIFTYNALIKGFCEDRDLGEAMNWYRKLGKNDCAPNRMTFGVLIPFACEMGDFELALELCKEAITRRSAVDEATLQGLVDGLVKESKVEEAKKLVESVRQSNKGYSHCKLKLPLDE